MSLQEVFAAMQEKNIVVAELDGELVVRAPQGVMDQGLMARLKVHKQALLDAIRGGVVIEGHAPMVPKITPDMLPLVSLSQYEIDLIVDSVAEGAAAIQDIYPLAPLQEGILFHHLLETQGDPYITRSIIAFDNRARLDAFLDALQTVINRHDILRSSVRWDGLPQPVQVVHRRAVLPVEELAPVQQDKLHQCLLDRTDPRQFRMDLQKAPLLAGFAVKDSQSDECWFAMLNHHMVDDNYTLQLILSEIRQVLSGQAGQLPPVQPYRNFIARMRADSPADHERYFREQLGDIDEPTAPFGLLNVQGNGGQVGEAVLPLEPDLAQHIRNSARRHSVTPASLFHLAWALVLGQCSGRGDVVFGTVLSGRLQGGGAAAVGMFINTLPIRVSLNRTVRESVAVIHRNLNELLMHEQASLALAQRCSAVPAAAPLFTALLNYRHSNMIAASGQSALLEWEGMRVIGSEERTNYPLTLSVDDLGQGFSLVVQSVAGIDPARVAGYLRTAVEGLATALEQNPRQLVDTIGIMPVAEPRQALFDFNDTSADDPAEQSLQALFEAQVKKTPDADALAFAGQTLSYTELNAKANQLAHYLRAQGVGPEVLVGLCVERSPDMAVGMLGILKAGGAYVPLDPQYPEQRIAYMLQDARIELLLTQQRLARTPVGEGIPKPEFESQKIYLDSDWQAIAQYPVDNPEPRNHPLNPAYIIYTSGSTGQPKGVVVSHRNAVHSTVARFARYQEPVGCYLLLSSFAFDSSVAGLFWTLGQGGCLCLSEDDEAKDPAALAELIAKHRVTHLLALPSFYSLLLAQAGTELQSLKTAIVAGEACATDVVKRHFALLPEVPLYNEYGPTEATVWSSVYRAGPDDLERPLSIGRPISNVRLYILDRSGNPVPIGVAGELHIGGEGIVRGYWRRPELTAEKFIPDPFLNDGGRLYKTGDLARYREDGNIEFLGRIDRQVKIRGFRIELEEIEARLLAYPGVEEAVVTAWEDRPGNKQLIAYVVGNTDSSLTAERLRENLKASLPDYMVPSAYVFLAQMPLTANGKIDRRLLPAPDRHEAQYAPPRTPAESLLASVWSEVLRLDRVGINDNYFTLGGDSILTIQVVGAARRHGLYITPRQLFEHQTVAELAAVAGSENKIMTRQDLVSGEIGLTPIQHWFFALDLPNPHHWNQSLLLTVDRPLAADFLEQVVQRLVSHHDALRLRFMPDADDNWRQVNLEHEAKALFSVVDLTGLSEDRQRQRITDISAELQTALNITDGPLLRVALFDLGAGLPQRLLFIVHHLAIDGVSWRILLEDLYTVYRQLEQGEEIRLPAKTTSYQQWSERLQTYAKSAEMQDELDFWLSPGHFEAKPLPVDYPGGSNLEQYFKTITVSLDEAETLALQQTIPAAFQFGVEDVLLGVLARVLCRWSGGDSVLLDLDRYGREDVFDDIDLTRTVGWFTNVHPVLLSPPSTGSYSDLIDSVKAQLNRIPNGGLGYGVLRYLGDGGRRQDFSRSQVLFNYLGQLDKALPAFCPFRLAEEPIGDAIDKRNHKLYDLEVVVMIVEKRLRISWIYSSERFAEAVIEKSARLHRQMLQQLIEYFLSAMDEEILASVRLLSGNAK
jgi:amino acid adenylation domain-containing protein/non-ribosomal peptide synthase protein (TIGR01720 family)